MQNAEIRIYINTPTHKASSFRSLAFPEKHAINIQALRELQASVKFTLSYRKPCKISHFPKQTNNLTVHQTHKQNGRDSFLINKMAEFVFPSIISSFYFSFSIPLLFLPISLHSSLYPSFLLLPFSFLSLLSADIKLFFEYIVYSLPLLSVSFLSCLL